MSSAALQTAPHQPAALTPPLLATSPALPYSSPSREASNAAQYNYNQLHYIPVDTLSVDSRRPSRRPSNTSSRSGAVTPTDYYYVAHQHQHQHQHLNQNQNQHHHLQPGQYSAPSMSAGAGPDTARRSMPPTAPPRSSSQYGASAAGGGRRDSYSSGSRGARSSSANGGRYDDPSRRHTFVPSQDAPTRSSSKTREAGASSRSHQHPNQPTPKSSSREASEALNRAIGAHDPVSREQQERIAQAHAHASAVPTAADMAATHAVPVQEARRNGRRGGHDKPEKFTRLGDYVLANTIGKGEFGKVKLGWRQQDGGCGKQYAIKLIKKDMVGENPNQLAKIWREVAILKRVSHPNIVKLIHTQDRDRYIGIILEYASGGELFDFILSQRCLKENVARRLFAQLVSGVGYLHKRGIVHRDLKLENLLLDSNRNIIITDFGFANTFDPDETLSEEEEHNLTDKEWVKKFGLDQVKKNGSRKGDLMQTSCGSPCYAAPELVISDSLYTGRKVDVWSCGVILYAMLAGYLPFDDDPANPEGDNINQLYRYIVSTPLTFPDAVGPGARDLLRRILVPNPRKRADLFEVARHSWLSEFAEVVEFITSSTTSPKEIQNSTVPAEELAEIPLVTRSTSVRESRNKQSPAVVGGLGSKHGHLDAEDAVMTKQQKDAKRRTVQVEYVAPQNSTRHGERERERGEAQAASSSGAPKSKSGRPSIEVTATGRPSIDKPLPEPPASRDGQRNRDGRRPPHPTGSSRSNNRGDNRDNRNNRAPPTTSDRTHVSPPAPARTATDGSLHSSSPLGHVTHSQPAPPEVAGTVAHGSIHQPQPSSPQPDEESQPPTSRSGVPPKFAMVSGFDEAAQDKAHRRSSTFGDFIGRRSSLFGSRASGRRPDGDKSRKYPPVSMANVMPANDGPRPSIDSRISRRSMSLGFGKKRSGSFVSQDKRRFSFLPHSFSAMIGLNSSREPGSPSINDGSQQDLPIQDPAEAQYTTATANTMQHEPTQQQSKRRSRLLDPSYMAPRFSTSTSQPTVANSRSSMQQDRPRPSMQQQYQRPQVASPTTTTAASYVQGAVLGNPSESTIDDGRAAAVAASQPEHAADMAQKMYRGKSVLQKHKRFSEAYDDDGRGMGATRRVMQWFRARGRERAGEAR